MRVPKQGRAGPALGILTRAMRRDGSKLHVELGFAVLINGPGEPIGALAIARDVTQRRLAEIASRKP